MDFIDQIKVLATKIPKLSESIKTEEGTKNALVMPLLNILGYNVFDPTEVVPEFTTDYGTKKGEKVDYAIIQDGKPIILIECKNFDADLDKLHASQLFRYFTVSEAKIGILTNGIIYRFYTDIDAPNKMDDKSFLEINLLDIKEPLINELKRFKKETFNIDDLASIACELKYTREIKLILANEINGPSEEFVKFFTKKVNDGPFTQSVCEKFTVITKNALNQFINDRINDRLKFAMSEDMISSTSNVNNDSEISSPEPGNNNPNEITTEEEIEGYHIVKSILRENVDLKRIVMRDKKSYCGILLDDNNRKPICRMYFNTKQKYLGLFTEEKNEEKVPIEDLNCIYSYADKLKSAVNIYENGK
ncbi:restriction endonuclease or methylase [Methanosarcina mazei]|uniref:Restriction endonuclease or methylase n=1 Tax=Methanosarcina mazei TaxID=2209 RepID=A0A0F8HSB8_METMZ|nr:type I restriction endonuclease [Methanosarcina mazei]KKG69844.1 restriction endonuclease or methylase [Methanosarcina mazei]